MKGNHIANVVRRLAERAMGTTRTFGQPPIRRLQTDHHHDRAFCGQVVSLLDLTHLFSWRQLCV